MNRKKFLTTATLLGTLAAFISLNPLRAASSPNAAPKAGRSTDARKKPNILIFYSDDLGWGDLGCFGHPVIKTPAIDRLAAEGCRLTDFYVCTPVCAPSRAGFMTGRDPVRYDLGFLMTADRPDWGIYHHVPTSEPSLPKLLKEGGYRTCHLGKWHLSLPQYPTEPTPATWGYDYYLTREGKGKTGSLYHDMTNWTRNGELIKPGELPEWAADAYVDETIRFIESSGDQPFFINLWTFTPHEDIDCSQKFKDMYPGRTPEEQLYFGTVSQMDDAYARILAYLDKKGLTDNTIVIFASDNGPETYVKPNVVRKTRGSTGPWRGGKRALYEGGIRVPAIVRWPGLTKAGSVSSVPTTTLDFLPTLCAVAGVKLPEVELDGTDFRPALRGEAIKREHPLYWQYTRADLLKKRNPLLASPPLAVRDGHWKLLCYPDYKTQVELYDLDIDIGEKWNMADRYPEITARMMDMMRECHEIRNRVVSPPSAYLNPDIPLPKGYTPKVPGA